MLGGFLQALGGDGRRTLTGLEILPPSEKMVTGLSPLRRRFFTLGRGT
jgi:hypothetical protein